jgi:hypothetical protein
MASKKKTAAKKTTKSSQKKAAAKKPAAKKKVTPKKKAAPKKQANPKVKEVRSKIVKEAKDTIEEVRVVVSNKSDVFSELAKEAFEESLKEQYSKKNFFQKIFGSKKKS